MLLALDIGNSHIKFGGYCGDDEMFVASIATDERQTSEQYAYMLNNILALYHIDTSQIDAAILCSVVPSVTPVLETTLRFLFHAPILTVSSGVKTGLNVKLDHPRTLGSDLVANAVWAFKQAKLPCVVVDCGTVTTFTALNRSGALVGTSIGVGFKLSLDAIKSGAAQLPTVPLAVPQHGVLGRNTAEAIQSGAIYGAAGMIDGLLDRFVSALDGAPTLWLTGGSAALVAPHLRAHCILTPHITLRGLNYIWQKNHCESSKNRAVPDIRAGRQLEEHYGKNTNSDSHA